MKLRRGHKAKIRRDSRVQGGEWERSEGYTAPGSLNPAKGTGIKDGLYSSSKASSRSRRAVEGRA